MDADPFAMAKLRVNADLFYSIGINGVPPPSLNKAMRTGILVALLRKRIQYTQCGLFAVCGRAIMVGEKNPYGLPGLDFFDGVTVQHDANICRDEVFVATNAGHGSFR